MLTLADTRNSPGIRRIIAKCKNSQQATDLINEAARRLMRRGDWFDTYVPVFICVYNGCLVMPRYVQQVRKVNLCNREIPVRNGWFEFLSYNQNYCGWGTWLNSWLGATAGMRSTGSSPVFQDIQGDGRYIRAYPRALADVGKTMRFYGQDNNGQPLITKNLVTGEITQGALLTIADPFGSTNQPVRHIDCVVREPTTLIVDVYAFNAATNLLEDIAHYEPTETTPTYSRYNLTTPWQWGSQSGTTGNCCNARKGIVAMVKLRFIDAQSPNDLVLVPCVDALKVQIMALILEDSYDRAGAREMEKDAIEIMNRELENNSPDDVFSVGVNTLGPGVWSNQAF